MFLKNFLLEYNQIKKVWKEKELWRMCLSMEKKINKNITYVKKNYKMSIFWDMSNKL